MLPTRNLQTSAELFFWRLLSGSARGKGALGAFIALIPHRRPAAVLGLEAAAFPLGTLLLPGDFAADIDSSGGRWFSFI